MKIEKKAAKALRKMPVNTARKFMASFEKIENGKTEGLDIKKMANAEYYRLRVGGYRAIYTVTMEVIVIDAGPRGGIYK